MTGAAKERCETCRFNRVIWRKGDAYEWENDWGDEKSGTRDFDHSLCRRSPPVIVAEHGPMWPAVELTDWCGEYQQREA